MPDQSRARRLAELRELQPDWNSYGAKPITEAALAAVEPLVKVLQTGTPHITPTNNGGIQIEFHEQGVDVEICIGPDGMQD